MVLDCIDSLSLPSFLHLIVVDLMVDLIDIKAPKISFLH